jgi:alanyl-tRNA synthetase
VIKFKNAIKQKIMITSNQLRKKYIDFFVKKNHAHIGSASLIPDNDPTVLFTTAGMHPLVPYLLGEKHPQGNRLVNVQKCVRTGDIDEVGDATHCTFFEMLGNWSLGDYFKKESIEYSYEFLTKELGINPKDIAITVFAGDSDAPKDTESANHWLRLGIPNERIFYLDKVHNWWGPAGQTGPCGPDTEIFIIRDVKCDNPDCSPACNCGKYVEIWNNVFMEYNKQEDGSYIPLKQKNVDTGMGLERTVAMLNGNKSVYEIDLFEKALKVLNNNAKIQDEKGFRIILDHLRTATFMLGDEKGITPSNVDQGYVLRRLIRRAIRYARVIELDVSYLTDIVKAYIEEYADFYKELKENEEKIIKEFEQEVERFSKTLEQGIKRFEKMIEHIPNKIISGQTAFRLYDTFGFPIEMTIELAKEEGFDVDVRGYEQCFEEHRAKSQAGSEQRFKGGLADNKEATARLHTATHLLLGALHKVFDDPNIQQRGSNITAERLRFDFNFDRALTEEELKKIEDIVNEAILKAIPVVCREMPIEDARAEGACGIFGDKYGDIVKVYSIEGYSKELCGGPHAANTKELGKFKIQKEQSSSSGVRRIRATLEE